MGMESKLRHDLRHPVATISMIASTMAAFGDDIDTGTVDSYLGQIQVERSRLAELVGPLRIDLSEFDEAVRAFRAKPTSKSLATYLDRVAQDLIGTLSSDDAP